MASFRVLEQLMLQLVSVKKQVMVDLPCILARQDGDGKLLWHYSLE